MDLCPHAGLMAEGNSSSKGPGAGTGKGIERPRLRKLDVFPAQYHAPVS